MPQQELYKCNGGETFRVGNKKTISGCTPFPVIKEKRAKKKDLLIKYTDPSSWDRVRLQLI